MIFLKGKQRSNPPSRYSEWEENKVSFSSLGSKHPWDKWLLLKADLWRYLCSTLSNLVGFFPLLRILLLYNNPAKKYHTDSQAQMLHGKNSKKRSCYWTYTIGEYRVTQLIVVVSQGLSWPFPRMLYKSNALLWSCSPPSFARPKYMGDFAPRVGMEGDAVNKTLQRSIKQHFVSVYLTQGHLCK